MYLKSLFGDSENLIKLGTSTLYNFGSLRKQEYMLYMFGILNKIFFCWWNFTYICLFLLSFKGQVNNFSDVVMKPLLFNTVSVLFSIKMHLTLVIKRNN